MFVKKIVQFDEDALEAVVIVSDGVHELMCYAQPFDKKEEFTLLAFMCSNIYRAENNCFVIEKTSNSHFSYKLQGEVLSAAKGIVKVGQLLINGVDYIPKDICNGEFVVFDVSRMDLI